MAEIYNAGTVAVVQGSKTLVLTGGAWTNLVVREGDAIIVAGDHMAFVEQVTDTSHIEMSIAYTGADASGQSYSILHGSYEWGLHRTMNELVAQYIQGLENPVRVDVGNGVPDDANGTDNGLYINADNGDLYLKETGVWTFKLSMRGPQGVKGDKGDKGDQGDPGTDGANGVDGINGADGANGLNGILSGLQFIKSADYAVVVGNKGDTLIADKAVPIEFGFDPAATLGSDFLVVVKNEGEGLLSLLPAGTETIDGEPVRVLGQGDSLLVYSTGTNLRTALAGGGGGETPSQKNFIDNGNFDHWRWGVSSNVDGEFCADRHRHFFGAGGAGTVSRQRHVVGQTDVPGEPEYLCRHDRTTPATAANDVWVQKIRGVRKLAGQEVTLTYFIYSTVTKDFYFDVQQRFGIGGAPSGAVVAHGETVTLTGGVWNKVQFKFAMPSISGKVIGDANDHLMLRIHEGAAFSAFTLDLSHFSLCSGDLTGVQDPSGPVDKDADLLRCMAYHWRINGDDGASTVYFAMGNMYSATSLNFVMPMPVPMHAEPNLIMSDQTHFQSVDNGTVRNLTAISKTNGNPYIVGLAGSGAGFVTGQATTLRFDGNPGVYIGFEAELW